MGDFAGKQAIVTVIGSGIGAGLCRALGAAHAAWLFARLAPGLLQRMAIRFMARQRAAQQAAV